ncbi:hypothetical protein CHH28_10270 [Bacterioplanes sanyensis]|uniref:Peptidase M48 domain-containing protein n=1 Tax=Bacterioplanes sanyensis TaxID=1249553 RepID=A0A222FJX1_9GAMM|nr:M48 family metallopeptidase [Bacterioplanes sanyensis]ASP39039.1 hypothetical protein CHH28_10270 [Bacterioplanes sanyensis]
MSQRPHENPILPDQINNAHEHPLKDFVILMAAVIAIIVALTWALAASASWLAPKVPFRWESGWFEPQHFMQLSPDQLAVQSELQQLMDKLLQGEDALPVHVHYLADEGTPNAFATLGGNIFVTHGLLEAVQSENGLAMVLAHEYAHVHQRHPMILLLEQLSLSLIVNLSGAADVGSWVSQQSSMLTLLAFSRDMERSADAYALERLQSVYGHSRGADEFFQHVLTQESHWQQFLQTHPLTSERLAHIESQPGYGELTPLPEKLTISR